MSEGVGADFLRSASSAVGLAAEGAYLAAGHCCYLSVSTAVQLYFLHATPAVTERSPVCQTFDKSVSAYIP